MPEPSSTERVQLLEQIVDELQLLPARVAAVESQILQLRDDVRDGVSAIQRQIREGDEETRRQMQVGDEETRRHLRVLHEEVLARIAVLHEGTKRKKR